MSDEHVRDNGKTPLISRFGAGERPEFGIPSRGKWVVLVAVVSASVGMFLFLGGTIGGLGGRSSTRIWVGAGVGAIVGAYAGVWIALRMADMGRSGTNLITAFVGCVFGMAVGMAVPVITAKAPLPFWPVLAVLSPGLGSAGALALRSWIESRGWLEKTSNAE